MEGEESTIIPAPGDGKSAVSVWAARVVFVVLGLSVLALGAAILLPGNSDGETTAFGTTFDTPVQTEDGQDTTFGEVLADQPRVINFYASWCGPCRAELPDFDEVSLRVEDQVQFVGINVDSTETTWLSFNQEIPVSYDTFFQPNSEIRRAIGSSAMPTTLFVSADGELLRTHSGILDDDSLIQILEEEFGAEV